MKVLSSILLLFIPSAGVMSQVVSSAAVPRGSNSPANLVIVEKEWHSQTRNPALEDDDPFRSNKEVLQTMREERQRSRENVQRARIGLPPLEPRARRAPASRPQTGDSYTIYTYELKVKNEGDKTIRALLWDYVFFDPEGKQELGRQQFINKVKIEPGKIKNLTIQTLTPPTSAINAKNAGKKQREQYSERIIIQGVEYADGSVWNPTP